jgi:two-component system, cell cycle sensor histidine kinase and response regulator CckA
MASEEITSAETVLLVDDEDALRRLLREMLSAYGYQVLEASDGAQALKICQQHAGRIDLLLSDVKMPGMTGPELALRLACMRPDMKLLYISGYATDAIPHYDLSTPFLAKPFSPDTLVRKVREVLHGQA